MMGARPRGLGTFWSVFLSILRQLGQDWIWGALSPTASIQILPFYPIALSHPFFFYLTYSLIPIPYVGALVTFSQCLFLKSQGQH